MSLLFWFCVNIDLNIDNTLKYLNKNIRFRKIKNCRQSI